MIMMYMYINLAFYLYLFTKFLLHLKKGISSNIPPGVQPKFSKKPMNSKLNSQEGVACFKLIKNKITESNASLF